MLAHPRADALGERFARRNGFAFRTSTRCTRTRCATPTSTSSSRATCGSRPSPFSTRWSATAVRCGTSSRADFSYMNERLARHYGIPGVAGEHFRRVEYTDRDRRGILGHASFLTPDLARQPHLAGAQGQVGDGGPAGHAPRPRPRPTSPSWRKPTRRPTAASSRCANVSNSTPPTRTASPATAFIDPHRALALENFDVTGTWRVRDTGTPGRDARRAVRRYAARGARRPEGRAAAAPGVAGQELHRESAYLRARPQGRVL